MGNMLTLCLGGEGAFPCFSDGPFYDTVGAHPKDDNDVIISPFYFCLCNAEEIIGVRHARFLCESIC